MKNLNKAEFKDDIDGRAIRISQCPNRSGGWYICLTGEGCFTPENAFAIGLHLITFAADSTENSLNELLPKLIAVPQ